MIPDNLFAGSYVDRRAGERLKPGWLDEARADPQARCLIMHGTQVLMRSGPGPRPALLPMDDARVRSADGPGQLLLLGWFRDRRCLLLDLPGDAPPPTADGECLAELRPLAGQLPVDTAGLLAYGRALALWRAGHRFCSRCGEALQAIHAGHAGRCPACGHTDFPRIDPAIIVLVHDGHRVLLGRQASWPPQRYSTIAGFVEPGESLEDAVRREVAEETGIRVERIRYHSSQPWPFPASLMLGFDAHGTWATPRPNDDELEDAGWFTRAQVCTRTVALPPPESISRRLIDHWLIGRTPA